MTETSPAPRTERLAKRLAAGLVAAGMVVMLFAVAYVHASQATAQARAAAATAKSAAAKAQATADCVNRILGARAPLTSADHANERQKIADQTVATGHESAGLKAALNPANTQEKALAGARLYQRGVAEFQKSLADWETRDDAITAQKRKHPLGRC